ncbi:MAG: hypothetical protein JWO97_4692 [Acidobacteria bacterium]|nr:hypothetical protein [Acidobacteriota bacterium]
MITKSELHDAHRRMLDEERGRLGDPPTAREMLAYSRGELSPEQEERVRELLALYPDLAQTMTAPFPDGEAKPGEPGYVSDDELKRRWGALQEHLYLPAPVQPGARVLQFWRITSALAAAIALAFGALLWQARSELGRPRVASESRYLSPDDRDRGGGTTATLTPGGDAYTLVTPLMSQPIFSAYKLEIVDAHDRSLWKSGPLAERDNDTFVILVPRPFLAPGSYKVILYGVGEKGEQQLDKFSMVINR